MTTGDTFLLAADIVLAAACAGLIGLAVVVLARSRQGVTVRLFRRVLHRPRLWAAAAACGGAAGLLFLTRERLLPDDWQDVSRDLLGALQLAFFALLSAHLVVQWRAERRRGR